MISKDQIFNIQNRSEFEETALAVFNFQAENNPVYAEFIGYLGVDPKQIKSIEQIPFLPIRFFKNRRVITGNREVEKTFTSSGTSGMERSRHFVTNLDFYRESLNHSFKYFYGDFSDYTIFGLLPSYLERSGSSLIDMVGYWIEQSGRGGFYLYNHDELHSDLIKNEEEGRKAILIGVSFALIDFVENRKMNLKNTIVMETGGMKGRKKEITRDELHSILKTGFGVDQIHSEYGMTELLSQAYSTGGAGFVTPPWMKVLIRDTEDPLSYSSVGRTGGINVIDLANLNSCSFIATDDLGKSNPDGSFKVLGRFDHSDVRGCNLMVSDL
ncbi:MAG: acyl transferase [Flavobacteriia bacterium]|nr:acyl transferase [Flavobacteriia bacterium]